MENKASTEAVVGKKANAPPQVITLEKEKQTSEAQTPKHANKKPDETKPEPEKRDDDQQRIPNKSWGGSGYQQFDQRRGGAFHPREQFGPPMQVSPGANRYFPQQQPPNYRYNNQFDYRAADFSHAPSYPQQRFANQSGPPGMYPQQYPGGQNYDGRPPAWGGAPPSFQQRPHEQYRGGPAASNNPNNANFSRAVSSSFDRSTNSGQQKTHSPKLTSQPPPSSDQGSVSEDASWGQLKQVHSVDEEEMRRRLSKRKDKEDVIVNQANSNSSSLTNSPTEEMEKKAAKAEPKNTSSLDSLCSVASAQEPMETKESKTAPSPDNTTGSLDLMKCPSGTSALLLPSHQRSLSQLSLSGVEVKDELPSKKDSDLEEPVTKKQRVEGKDKKSSPLTITCSPPTSPGGTNKKKTETKMHQPQAVYPATKNESSARGTLSHCDHGCAPWRLAPSREGSCTSS